MNDLFSDEYALFYYKRLKGHQQYLQFLLNGQPELANPGLDALRKLTVITVQIPQQIGQSL